MVNLGQFEDVLREFWARADLILWARAELILGARADLILGSRRAYFGLAPTLFWAQTTSVTTDETHQISTIHFTNLYKLQQQFAHGPKIKLNYFIPTEINMLLLSHISVTLRKFHEKNKNL